MSGVWLALDTATDVASVALGAEGTGPARAARAVQGARQHAAQLLALVDQVLTLAAARLDELAGIVVGDGPGSFTGLRIGWAAAKGLAHDRRLPVHAVPSLMATAHAAAPGAGGGPVLVTYDALRGQVFGAVYAFPPGRVETLVAPALFAPGELAAAAPGRPTVVVDESRLAHLPPVAASLLVLLGLEGAAGPALDPAAEPTYGRPAEAQAKWEARHGRPLPHSPR